MEPCPEDSPAFREVFREVFREAFQEASPAPFREVSLAYLVLFPVPYRAESLALQAHLQSIR